VYQEKDWGSVLTEAITWPPRVAGAVLPFAGGEDDPPQAATIAPAMTAAKARMRRPCLLKSWPGGQ